MKIENESAIFYKRKQAENKQNKNPLYQFSKIRLHISLIRQQKFSVSKKLADIFIFSFGIFFLFPRTAVSRVQRRKGAKQIFCDGNFLEIMVYWEHGKGERVWDY